MRHPKRSGREKLDFLAFCRFVKTELSLKTETLPSQRSIVLFGLQRTLRFAGPSYIWGKTRALRIGECKSKVLAHY